MTRARSALLPALAALAALAAAAPAQAAEQPEEAPPHFHNGDANSFGSVAMAPYVPAGRRPVPVEAAFVLEDLSAVRAASDVLFAFNLKGDAAKVTLGSLGTADGRTLTPMSTATVEGGRQPQAHFAPGELLAAARDGRLELVLRGTVEPKADGQIHVGAMAIAFGEAWRVLPSGDGSAELYGFTMVMAQGVGGGPMPFQGQGNTWLVLPFALAACAAALLGGAAVRMLAEAPALAAPTATPAAPAVANAVPSNAPAAASVVAARLPPPSQVPVFGGPSSPTMPLRPAQPVPSASAPAVPVFGSAAPVGVKQGPRLPPHPLLRSEAPLADPSPPSAGPAPASPAPAAARSAAPASRSRPASRPQGPAARAASRPAPAHAAARRQARRQASR